MTGAAGRELPRATLGRYRLICELGSGGMAHVYLALTTGLGGFTKLAVLKVMRAELAKNPEAVKLFLGEARLAARFNHPNVVQTTEVGEDSGCYFISMEYLEGLPLGLLLGKTLPLQLPLAARLEIVCQMLDGLGYLHELSDLAGSSLCLVHRDISPSNVFVTFEGTVKLLDFGVAKAEGVSEVSEAGSFKGKIGYAAPEQLRGESDARSDIFTAGLLLWEVLSYRRLRLDRAYADIVRGRVTGADAQLMRSNDHGIPPELLDICVKAAALDPEERYQSASVLRDALRSYMVENSLRFSTEQLRLVLVERFDVLRQTNRKHIDQRLKAVQNGDAGLAPSVRPPSQSRTPQPFVDSSQQHDSLVTLRGASKARSLLGPAGGVVLVLTAGFVGAFMARGARSGPAMAGNQPSEASSAPAKVVGVDPSHLREQSPAGDRFVTPPQALVERASAEEETAGTERGDTTSFGRAPSKSTHRPEARSLARARPASRGVNEAVTQGAAPPLGRSLPEEARSSPSGPSLRPDFSHARGTAKVARPIDTSSPYFN